MGRFCVESDGSLSSGSDHLESFLSQIQKSEKESKYRLSTNSLSDFITDNSCTSDDCHGHLDGENINNDQVVRNNTKPVLNHGGGSHKKQWEKTAPQAKFEQLSKTLPRAQSLHNKGFKGSDRLNQIRSVATPVRKVIFSSDSDDNVFETATTTRPRKVKKTPFQSLAFSDSEKENSFEVYRNIPVKVPQFVITSSDESDNEVPVNIQKCVLSAAKEIDSDNDYVPLKDRLENSKLSKDLNSDKNSRNLVCSIGSLTCTPQKQLLATKQYFHTEKIVKTFKKTCLVPGCFLDSLDGVISKNSGSNFKKVKLELTAKLFKFFNCSVFSSRLPDTMKVSWAKRLTKTAGITKCRRQISKTDCKSATKCTGTNYEAEIVLSDKVIDCASRLRDTLIHEMCHAAVWVLNNINESHGPFWKSWAAKARKIHPELPSIDRCHNYDIEYKYQYKCTRCESIIGRHSKSIDTEKKVCGKCSGKLELLTKKKGNNPFANFVKENYKGTKAKMESVSFPISHREVMMSLSEQFKATSIAQNTSYHLFNQDQVL